MKRLAVVQLEKLIEYTYLVCVCVCVCVCVLVEEHVAISLVEHQMNYKQVLFYTRVAFLKNITRIKRKIPV
jgi:hypothetical protein